MNQLNWQRYFLVTWYNRRFLLLCAVGGLILGFLLNTLILKPSYSSHAKLLIKGGKAPTFVTPLQTDTEVKALTTNGNPLLTQIEVLNSSQLAYKVLQDMESFTPIQQLVQYKRQYSGYFEPETLSGAIKLKNPPNTDVVTLKLTTPDKTFSKTVLQSYIDGYKDFLQHINHESLRQQGRYIQNQITATEEKLKAVRQELMQFRLQNKTVDLPNEAQANIQQISDLETDRINLIGQISAKQGAISRLRRLLGMSSSQGIQSVALGMNASLVDTQKTLNNALQEYQTLSVKYTDENPNMQQLKAKIQEIQTQLVDEARRTVSQPTRRGLHISDPVRSNLVNNLANAEAELRGLVAQRAALSGNLASVKAQTNLMPLKQLRLSELLDSEKVLSDMVNLLKQKAAEAEFQASDALSNVVVIESATLPIKADTPTPFHILLVMTMFGLLAGLSWLLGLEWIKMQSLRPLQQQFEDTEQRREKTYSA